MLKKRFSIIALTLVMVLVMVPTIFAQIEGINFEDYDLDLSEDEKAAVESALEDAYENYDEITKEDILEVLEDLEEDAIEDVEEPEETEEEDGIGQELSALIKEYKLTEEWKEKRGQGLSKKIHAFLDENNVRDEEEVPEQEQDQEQDTLEDEEEVQMTTQTQEQNKKTVEAKEKAKEKKDKGKDNGNKGNSKGKGKGK